MEVYRFSQFLHKNCPDLLEENTEMLMAYFFQTPKFIKEEQWDNLCNETVLKALGMNKNELLHFNDSTQKYDWNSLAFAKRHKLFKFLKSR